MNERWLPVVGFPEYAVSNMGRVKRIVPDRQGKSMNRVLKPSMPNNGYWQVQLYLNGVSSHQSVHRLVCIAFHGEPPTPAHHASHRDGTRTNNQSGNLRWRTPSENNMERHLHGTMLTGDKHPSKYMPEYVLRGSRHGNAKLTEDAVIRIRADSRTGVALAKEYNVSTTTISKVRKHLFWRHVP